MERRRAFLFGSSVAIGTAIVAACSIYDPSLLAPIAAADASSPLDGGEASTPDADSCAHASPPLAPAADDGTAALDLVFVLDSVQLLEAKTPLGYDLDGVCTCPGPEACKSASTPPKAHCDDDAGRDNSGGATLATFATVSDGFSEDAINARLRSGESSILLRLRGYNGGANDTQVTAIVYRSSGVEPTNDSGTSAPPKFDGTDRWLLDPSSIVGGSTAAGLDCEGNPSCIALTFDPKAYVTDHVLVTRADILLRTGNGTQIDLTNTVLTARIVPRGASLALAEGSIAGRWRSDRLLAMVANSDSPAGPGPICDDTATYESIKQLVCGAADLPSDPALDRTDVPCDALSLGLAFTAVPARLGKVSAPSTDTPPCGAWVDSCK